VRGRDLFLSTCEYYSGSTYVKDISEAIAIWKLIDTLGLANVLGPLRQAFLSSFYSLDVRTKAVDRVYPGHAHARADLFNSNYTLYIGCL
jgi:hypothetical protein